MVGDNQREINVENTESSGSLFALQSRACDPKVTATCGMPEHQSSLVLRLSFLGVSLKMLCLATTI